MKKIAIVLLFLATLLTGTASAQASAQFKQMFWQQLSASCRPGLRWEKSITEVAEDGSRKTETKLFEVDCYGGTAKAGVTTIDLDPAEFAHLWEFVFDNPKVADALAVTQTALLTEAKPKAGREEDGKLRLQRFVLHPVTGKLLEAEAHIVKASPLYDLDVKIKVSFDEAGYYAAHTVETQTSVVMGGDVHTIIQAKLVP